MCKFMKETTTKKPTIIVVKPTAAVDGADGGPQVVETTTVSSEDVYHPIQDDKKFLTITLPVFLMIISVVVFLWCLIHNKKFCKFCFPKEAAKSHKVVDGECICKRREKLRKAPLFDFPRLNQCLAKTFRFCKRKKEKCYVPTPEELKEKAIRTQVSEEDVEIVCECNREKIKKIMDTTCRAKLGVDCQNIETSERDCSLECTDPTCGCKVHSCLNKNLAKIEESKVAIEPCVRTERVTTFRDLEKKLPEYEVERSSEDSSISCNEV